MNETRILLHELTDDTPGDAWVTLPNGDVMRVFQYLDMVRQQSKIAAVKLAEARRQRRHRRYADEAEF